MVEKETFIKWALGLMLLYIRPIISTRKTEKSSKAHINRYVVNDSGDDDRFVRYRRRRRAAPPKVRRLRLLPVFTTSLSGKSSTFEV